MNDFRNTYATRTDICHAFETEIDRLYLLAFMLTANHDLAEQCFLRVLEEAQSDQLVFKPFVSSWIRRNLIKRAVAVIFQSPLPREQRHDRWFRHTNGGECIDAVTQLSPIERFAFVTTVLESYSGKECSLLLGCDPRTVEGARLRALKQLGIHTLHLAKENECLPAIA